MSGAKTVSDFVHAARKTREGSSSAGSYGREARLLQGKPAPTTAKLSEMMNESVLIRAVGVDKAGHIREGSAAKSSLSGEKAA
jgi:hypothetical protein